MKKRFLTAFIISIYFAFILKITNSNSQTSAGKHKIQKNSNTTLFICVDFEWAETEYPQTLKFFSGIR